MNRKYDRLTTKYLNNRGRKKKVKWKSNSGDRPATPEIIVDADTCDKHEMKYERREIMK